LASNVDSSAIIQKMLDVQSLGLNRLKTKKAQAQNLQAAYKTLGDKLTTLKSSVATLADTATFNAKAATSSTDVLSTTATEKAAAGTYSINIVAQSTATRITSGSVISTGTLDTKASLYTAGLSTPVTGDTEPTKGSFTVNGVAITFDILQDSIDSVVSKINTSAAGVTAIYDKFTDRMVVANKTGGSAPVEVLDVGVSTLGASLKLTAAEGVVTELGQSAQVSIAGLNNGNPISSVDNTFTETETGIAGLSFTLNKSTGASEISVKLDPTAVKANFDTFIKAYNDVMDYIARGSAVTGTEENISAGIFTSDQSVLQLQASLRSTLGAKASGNPVGFDYLGALGVGTTGVKPSISVFNATKLTAALTDNPDGVKKLLTDTSTGLMTKLNSFITSQVISASGFVRSKSVTSSDRISNLTETISRETLKLKNYETRIRANFNAMEKAVSSYGGGLSQMLSNLNVQG